MIEEFIINNAVAVVLIIILVTIWDVVWKAIAMWRAAKRDSKTWFVILMIVNSVGVLPILYLIFTRRKPGIK